MQAKTDHIAAKAKATRDLMIKVEKAAAEHSKAGPVGGIPGEFLDILNLYRADLIFLLK